MPAAKISIVKQDNASSLITLGIVSYRAFHRFGQAKFGNGGSILSSSQFSQMPQQPQKMTLALKVVQIDSKIIISVHKSKSVTQSVELITDLSGLFLLMRFKFSE